MKKEVLETIKKYNLIENGDKLVVAVSGGPDSITLLHILNFIKENNLINFEMCVAHVHHGLRANADLDEEYVKKFCSKINVECFVHHANVKEEALKEKIGIEEAGRKVRYSFFDEILEKTGSNKIAIAHNYNDVAETVFMNIVRGSGINGLKGIEPKNGKYIRPLIKSKRSDIEKYCKENNLNPRHDESNDENEYSRNKVRNIFFPKINDSFKANITASLNRLSEIATEETEYINSKVREAYKSILLEENTNVEKNGNNIVLDLKKFNMEEKIIKKKIILLCIEKLFGTINGIEKIHLEDIIKLCNNGIGNKYLMPNKFLKIEIKNRKIYIFKV